MEGKLQLKMCQSFRHLGGHVLLGVGHACIQCVSLCTEYVMVLSRSPHLHVEEESTAW